MRVDHDEDKEGDSGFTFVVKKEGCIGVRYHGKLAAIKQANEREAAHAIAADGGCRD